MPGIFNISRTHMTPDELEVIYLPDGEMLPPSYVTSGSLKVAHDAFRAEHPNYKHVSSEEFESEVMRRQRAAGMITW